MKLQVTVPHPTVCAAFVGIANELGIPIYLQCSGGSLICGEHDPATDQLTAIGSPASWAILTMQSADYDIPSGWRCEFRTTIVSHSVWVGTLFGHAGNSEVKFERPNKIVKPSLHAEGSEVIFDLAIPDSIEKLVDAIREALKRRRREINLDAVSSRPTPHDTDAF